jgi:PAS domain S-box-containing protein
MRSEDDGSLGDELALLRQALDLTGTGFVLTDPGLDDNPIVYVNESFLEITGFAREEVLGRNCRFLQGEGSEPEAVAELRAAIAEQRPVTVELLNRRRDGTDFRNEVHVAPVRNDRGEVVRFVGVQIDVTAARRRAGLPARERRAREVAEAAAKRSAYLARASPELAASLDLRSTLDALARLSVPELGDVCLVDVLERDEVRRVAYAAADPAVEQLMRTLPRTYAVAPDGSDPVTRVLASRRSEIVHGEAASIFGGLGGALGDQAPRNAMLVPLVAGATRSASSPSPPPTRAACTTTRTWRWRRTSPAGRGWHSTTPASTSIRATWPGSCRRACCPSAFPSTRAWISAAPTGRRATAPRSAATSTTRSRWPTDRSRWSSAT